MKLKKEKELEEIRKKKEEQKKKIEILKKRDPFTYKH